MFFPNSALILVHLFHQLRPSSLEESGIRKRHITPRDKELEDNEVLGCISAVSHNVTATRPELPCPVLVIHFSEYQSLKRPRHLNIRTHKTSPPLIRDPKGIMTPSRETPLKKTRLKPCFHTRCLPIEGLIPLFTKKSKKIKKKESNPHVGILLVKYLHREENQEEDNQATRKPSGRQHFYRTNGSTIQNNRQYASRLDIRPMVVVCTSESKMYEIYRK